MARSRHLSAITNFPNPETDEPIGEREGSAQSGLNATSSPRPPLPLRSGLQNKPYSYSGRSPVLVLLLATNLDTAQPLDPKRTSTLSAMLVIARSIEYEYRFTEYRFTEYRFTEYRFTEYRFTEYEHDGSAGLENR